MVLNTYILKLYIIMEILFYYNYFNKKIISTKHEQKMKNFYIINYSKNMIVFVFQYFTLLSKNLIPNFILNFKLFFQNIEY